MLQFAVATSCERVMSDEVEAVEGEKVSSSRNTSNLDRHD